MTFLRFIPDVPQGLFQCCEKRKTFRQDFSKNHKTAKDFAAKHWKLEPKNRRAFGETVVDVFVYFHWVTSPRLADG